MTPELRPESIVGDIVARDGRTAAVFSRHGIDFWLETDRAECRS